MNQRWLGSVECIAVQKNRQGYLLCWLHLLPHSQIWGHFNAGKPECGDWGSNSREALGSYHQCRLPSISCVQFIVLTCKVLYLFFLVFGIAAVPKFSVSCPGVCCCNWQAARKRNCFCGRASARKASPIFFCSCVHEW